RRAREGLGDLVAVVLDVDARLDDVVAGALQEVRQDAATLVTIEGLTRERAGTAGVVCAHGAVLAGRHVVAGGLDVGDARLEVVDFVVARGGGSAAAPSDALLASEDRGVARVFGARA